AMRVRVWEAEISQAEKEQRYHVWQQRQAQQDEQTQDWFAAAFYLGALLDRDPENAALKARRDRALAELARANPSSYYLQAEPHFTKGDYDKALADCSEAIRLNPQEANSYERRGACYFRKQEFDKAVADFTEAIRLSPKGAENYNHRGLAYFGKGDYDKAVADC